METKDIIKKFDKHLDRIGSNLLRIGDDDSDIDYIIGNTRFMELRSVLFEKLDWKPVDESSAYSGRQELMFNVTHQKMIAPCGQLVDFIVYNDVDLHKAQKARDEFLKFYKCMGNTNIFMNKGFRIDSFQYFLQREFTAVDNSEQALEMLLDGVFR